MKKFKHKKTGYIATETHFENNYIVTEPKITIPKWIVENSDEWEELIEKDYEILSFYSGYEGNPKSYIFSKQCNGLYSKGTGDVTLEHALKFWNIHSVERLSDGEIFTIGDKVKQSNVIHNNCFVITGFEFDVNKEHLLAIGNGGIRISKIEKVKYLLFTTEDGVDIFEGDKFYFIASKDTKFEKGIGVLLATNNIKAEYALARFSTKPKAEEYILMNKPMLCLNDIFSIYPQYKKNSPLELTKHAKELIDLVKSKI